MTPTAVSAPVGQVNVSSAIRRVLTPSFSDCLFISMIAWLFMLGTDGWSRLLLDGDCGWHIRTGEYILDHGAVPRQDLFSFSKAGEPWFAWEWGTDVLFAWIHRMWGLRGIVILGGVQIAMFAVILIRYMLWRGANTLIAVGVGLLALGASSLHYLARPHLITMILVPATIWLLERDKARNDRLLWSLIPITAAWTNLHGGFLAGIACMGIYTVGTAIETYRSRSGAWRQTCRYAAVTVLAALATLINPYTYHLHQHIARYLTSDWIRDAVEEFHSPSFRSENMMQFEYLLLLGLMAAASVLARRSATAPLLILFWAHQSLGSVRHATIFVTVAAPVIALEATRLWQFFIEGSSRKSVRRILDGLASDTASNFGWTSLWPAAFVAALLTLPVWPPWPADFPDLRFPVKMVAKYRDRLVGGRVITTDQWADYLIYRFEAKSKVFFDGRSDFYGPDLGKQYIRLSGGGHDWRKILDNHRFDTALIPPDWALGSLLKQAPDWKLLEDDGKSLIFVKVAPGEESNRPKKAEVPLMKSRLPSEISMGDLTGMKQGKIEVRSSIVAAEVLTPARAEAPGHWRLPSGQRLEDFALNRGFIVPGLLRRLPTAGPANTSVLPAQSQNKDPFVRGFLPSFLRPPGMITAPGSRSSRHQRSGIKPAGQRVTREISG